MIPKNIEALFEFIDFLIENKKIFENYIDINYRINDLSYEKSKLKPNDNYYDKQKYSDIENEIKEIINIIDINVINLIKEKLIELELYKDNDPTYLRRDLNISNNISIDNIDVETINNYRLKYIEFIETTDIGFYTLSRMFSELNNYLKIIFDYFKKPEVIPFDELIENSKQINNITQLSNYIKSSIDKQVNYKIDIEKALEFNTTKVIPESTNISPIFCIDNSKNIINNNTINGNKNKVNIKNDNIKQSNNNKFGNNMDNSKSDNIITNNPIIKSNNNKVKIINENINQASGKSTLKTEKKGWFSKFGNLIYSFIKKKLFPS